jgi:hypothetical protein
LNITPDTSHNIHKIRLPANRKNTVKKYIGYRKIINIGAGIDSTNNNLLNSLIILHPLNNALQ